MLPVLTTKTIELKKMKFFVRFLAGVLAVFFLGGVFSPAMATLAPLPPTSVAEVQQEFDNGASGVVVITYDLRRPSGGSETVQYGEYNAPKGGINYSPYKNWVEAFFVKNGQVTLSHTSKVTTSRLGVFTEPTSGELGEYQNFINGVSGFALFDLEGVADYSADDGASLHGPYDDENNFSGVGSHACFRNVGNRGNWKDAQASWSSLKGQIISAQKTGVVMWIFRYVTN